MAAAVLAELARAGVSLRVNGDRLAASPAASLTDELRALIREHKPELLAELSLASRPDVPTPTCERCRHWWRHPDGAATGDCLRNHFDTNAGDDCHRFMPWQGHAWRTDPPEESTWG